MPITVNMPALSPTMTEGKLASWLKKEGDEVRSGDVIAEIETDKATMEVEATDDGKLAKILIAAGTDEVAVNTPIAILAEEGDDAAAIDGAAKSAASAAPAPAPAPAPVAAPAAVTPPAPTPAPASAAPAPAPAAVPAAPPPKAAAPTPGRSPGARVIASPLARRLAANAGLDIARVDGSGPRGRVVKADVEAALGAGISGGGGIFAARGQEFTPAAVRAEPHSSIRKVIARRLVESKQTVPHYYVTMDCEIDALLSLRKEINDTDESLRISVNDFVIRALALALREVPEANVAWSDDGLQVFSGVDVSVAVSTEGGLITPIVRAADRKGVAVIAAEMKDLAGRARDGKLMPEEYQGGTTTVSNMGMLGVREFTAIINPPQATIIAVGAGEERPVVRDGEITTATMMNVTISCDHRVVDGALGAKLLGAFKQLIEHPIRLIL